jgi:hypothetical protein
MMSVHGKVAAMGALAGVGFAAMLTAGCVSTPAMAQRGYYETPPMYDDGYYRRPPPRNSYQRPGYYPEQGWQDRRDRDRDRGYYHQPRQHYAPQPRFYDKEAAKDYWRAQKEAQKRAIKRGYYNQPQTIPQQGFGGGGGGGGGGGVAVPYRRGGGATAGD